MATLAIALTGSVAHAAPSCCSIYDVQPDLGLSVRGNQVGLDVDGGQFSFRSGVSGQLLAVAARGEIVLPWQLTARLRAPFYFLSTNYGTAYGPGDVGLALKRPLFALEEQHFELSAGFSAELPTGDPHAGLGMGHVMLAPVLAAAGAIKDVGLQLEVGYIYALPIGEHGIHGHQSLVNPHDQQELNSTFAAGYRLSDSFWIRAYINGALTINPHKATVGSRLTTGPGIIYRHEDGWAAQLNGEIPLTANRANDWRTTLSGSYQF